MKFISYISVFMIPVLILYILGYGLIAKRNIYNDFVEGTEEGLKIVWRLVPTLIGLMTAVGVLRASGFLEFLGGILSKASGALGIGTGTFSAGTGEAFFFQCCDRSASGYFQTIRNRLPDRTDGCVDVERDRKCFLLYECLFRFCRNTKNPIHTTGGIACLTCRNDGCCVYRAVVLNKLFVFLKHLMDYILCVYTEMFLVFSGKLFYVDWFAVFQNDMS